MAVAFDTVSTGVNGTPWNHTCTGSSLLLVVQIGDFTGSDVESTSGITYNGVALTKLTSHPYNTSRPSLWYLIAPATGTHSISVTAGSTVACVASSWTGVHQTTPLGTAVNNTGASSTPASGSITGATSSMIIAHTGNLTDTLTNTGTGQNTIGNSTSGGFHCGGSYRAGTGSAYTFSWSGYSSDTRWAVLAIEILAVASATNYTQTNTGALTSAGAVTRHKTSFVFLFRVPPAMTGALQKKPGKPMVGAINSVGTLFEKVKKAFTGGITSAGALVALKAVLISVGGSIASSGRFISVVGKHLTAGITPSGTLAQKISRSFSGTLTSAGTIQKTIGKFLRGVMASAGALINAKAHPLPARITSSIQMLVTVRVTEDGQP